MDPLVVGDAESAARYLTAIAQQMERELAKCRGLPGVKEIRGQGLMMAPLAQAIRLAP